MTYCDNAEFNNFTMIIISSCISHFQHLIHVSPCFLIFHILFVFFIDVHEPYLFLLICLYLVAFNLSTLPPFVHTSFDLPLPTLYTYTALQCFSSPSFVLFQTSPCSNENHCSEISIFFIPSSPVTLYSSSISLFLSDFQELQYFMLELGK